MRNHQSQKMNHVRNRRKTRNVKEKSVIVHLVIQAAILRTAVIQAAIRRKIRLHRLVRLDKSI